MALSKGQHFAAIGAEGSAPCQAVKLLVADRWSSPILRRFHVPDSSVYEALAQVLEGIQGARLPAASRIWSRSVTRRIRLPWETGLRAGADRPCRRPHVCLLAGLRSSEALAFRAPARVNRVAWRKSALGHRSHGIGCSSPRAAAPGLQQLNRVESDVARCDGFPGLHAPRQQFGRHGDGAMTQLF